MIHKRGLSPDELNQLDPEIFEQLMLYDAVIEPNGARVDQIRFANLCHLILLSSGNLTEAGMKNAKVEDWDMFGLLHNKSTKELHDEAVKSKNEEQQKQFNQLAETIKDIAMQGKNNNGKK
ncbi:hypothetical protein ACWXWG_10940 [Pantoea ananatis]